MKWVPLGLGLLGVLATNVASAATVHVNGGARCPGDGSESAPYCSLPDGLGAATPGDVVAVQEFDGAYPVTNWPATAVDGTPDERIVVEPAPGHAPVIGGRITINNRSYWTIRGLTIDATENPSGPGIEVRSPTTTSRGVHVVGNRVLGIRGRGIKTGLFTDEDTLEVLIEDNYVDGGEGAGIELTRTHDSIVRNNVVEGITCTTGEFKLQEGVLAIECERPEIVGNHISNFVMCADGPAMLRAVGIRARKSNDGLIRNNLVEVRTNPGATFSGGISIHEESSGWTVVENVVRETGGCGLCDGADFGFATDNVWAHNTVVTTTIGIRANESTDATFEYNLVFGADVAAELQASETGATFRGNLFFTDANASEAFVNRGEALDLDGWSASCGCTEGDAFADPELTVDGLTPGAMSPAIDAATSSPWRDQVVGADADVGAFEPPAFVSAAVSEDGTEVLVRFDNAAHPPLQPDQSCAAFSVLRAQSPIGLTSCVSEDSAGETTVRIALGEPLYRDDVAELRTLANLTDSADVGGAAAMVEPVGSPLPTGDLPLPPEPTGTDSDAGSTGGPTGGETVSGDPTSATGTAGSNGGTDGGGEEQTPPSDHGCQCASTPHHPSAWLLALFFGFRRRRARSPRRRR